jgi:uncharacterized membrane protein
MTEKLTARAGLAARHGKRQRFTQKEETKMAHDLFWICMVALVVYIVIREDPDEIAPATLTTRIVSAVIILGAMALFAAATYGLSSSRL